MAESVWRRRAPLWLRIVAGILLLPLLGLALLFAAGVLGLDTPLVWILPIAAGLAWLIAHRAPTPIAAALLVLGPLGFALVVYEVQQTLENVSGTLDQAAPYPYEGHADEATDGDDQSVPPAAEAPGPDLGAPSGGGAPPGGGGLEPSLAAPPPLPSLARSLPSLAPPQPSLEAEETSEGGGGSAGGLGRLPEFPWPPPAASASYVLPDKLFESYRTLGNATGAILAALEQNGYVERSFFRTEPGGVALVTRLERINDDGSPSAENERWPASATREESTRGLLDFLQGLFFVDPGHYRVIAFVLQDLPFSQSAETITAQQAHAWLTSGANVLSPEIAALPFTGGHVTVLIYEFASDGSKVQVVTSQLTGKQHLERAGVLAILDKAQ